MAHGHQNHCQHALAVCEPCDTAYCTKCNREWRNQHWNLNWYSNYPTYYNNRPFYGTTTAGLTNTTPPSQFNLATTSGHTHTEAS